MKGVFRAPAPPRSSQSADRELSTIPRQCLAPHTRTAQGRKKEEPRHPHTPLASFPQPSPPPGFPRPMLTQRVPVSGLLHRRASGVASCAPHHNAPAVAWLSCRSSRPMAPSPLLPEHAYTIILCNRTSAPIRIFRIFPDCHYRHDPSAVPAISLDHPLPERRWIPRNGLAGTTGRTWCGIDRNRWPGYAYRINGTPPARKRETDEMAATPQNVPRRVPGADPWKQSPDNQT